MRSMGERETGLELGAWMVLGRHLVVSGMRLEVACRVEELEITFSTREYTKKCNTHASDPWEFLGTWL